MKDIELIVKISEEDYEAIRENSIVGDITIPYIFEAIRNGVQLPEDHGRLIDAERLLTVIHKNTVGNLFDELIDMQPTIIEESEESEEKEWEI